MGGDGTGTLAIEVNDVGLVALRAGAARPAPESPGLVLLDGATLLVGAEAAARRRTEPRFVHDSFWEGLSTEPVGRPFPPELRRADLAHLQLKALGQDAGAGVSEVILAVPGSFGPGALGLLLSVARAAGLPVAGLVDAAVAAASLGHPGERLLHLDLTRHRAVLTELVQGEEVVRVRVAAPERLGWAAFEDAFAETVAGQFVRETRFDPLHAGATDQALHDALPGWLGELGLRQALSIGLSAAGREHRIELARTALLAGAADLYRGLVDQVGLAKRVGEPATLLLSARAARLPGLADRLREIRGLGLVELVLGAAVAGVLEHRERIRRPGDALPFVTRLPSGLTEAERHAAAKAPAALPASASEGRRPTHVLHDAGAYRIDQEGLFIGTAPPEGVRGLVLRGETAGISRHHCTVLAVDGEVVVEDRSSFGVFVNDERVSSRAILREGDRLRLGSPGIELRLIAVERE